MSVKKKKANKFNKNISELAQLEKLKIEKWLKNLSFTQRHYVQRFAEQYFEDRQDPINEALDTAITAALMQMFEELDLEDVFDYQDLMMKLFNDHIALDKKLKDEGMDIMKNKIDLQPKVRERVTELINKGTTKKESIAILALEFPTLSKASLTNEYGKVKQEIKEVDNLKNISEKITEKIIEENIEDDIKEAYEKIFDEEYEEAAERKEEVKKIVEENTTRTLKVIRKETLAVGKFGEYKMDLEGVKVGEWLFKSIEEVNKFEKNEVEKLKRRIAEVEGRAIETREMFFI